MRIFFYYIFVVLVLWSCSTTKKAVVVEKETPKTDSVLVSDEKEKEFEYLFIEGLKQKMLANPQKAVQLFSSCLEIKPNSAAAMFELANIHASNNDITSATLLLEKAITINSENKWYKILLARLFQQSKRFSEAANIYKDLYQNYPDKIDYLYFNAMMLSSAEMFDEAIEAYNLLEKEVGMNEQISVAKQQLFVSSGSVDKAFDEIWKLIDSNPVETKYFGLLADLYLSQDDKENALKYYQKILELEPQNGFVHFSLASFYQESGDIEKAFDHTKTGFKSKKVELGTKLQLYLMLTANRAQTELEDGKNVTLNKILIESHPDDSRVYTLYAEYLLRNQNLIEARAQLEKALELFDADYLIWERLLFIDNDLQDWEGLYNHSKSALELFPNQPQVYFLNGVASLQLNKLQETFDICDEGLDIVVDNPPLEGQFTLLKAEANYKLDKFDEAFQLFDKAIHLDPENLIAQNNYAYYLSLIGKDLDKAERMSGKVIERFPDNSTYLDTHAWVLFKRQKYELAKFYIESAISNGGGKNPTLLEHYGDILYMLERLEEAKDNWQKSKDNGNESSILDKKIKDLKYYDN